MRKKPLQPQISDTLSIRHFKSAIDGWIADSEYRQLSPQTIAIRRLLVGKFVWFCEREAVTCIDANAVRRFLSYVTNAHTTAEGRFPDDPRNLQRFKPLRPASVANYFNQLRIIFNFLVDEREIAVSPMATLRPPRVPKDQKQPLSAAQLEALADAAAKSSRYPKRDRALLLFLLDTGARRAEAAHLTMQDINMLEGWCIVRGKGNKIRRLQISPVTRRALGAYLREAPRGSSDPVFEAEGGGPLTPNGLTLLIRRMGARSGVSGVRVSPHTFRHTMAITFLREGGDVFTLQHLLGHTRLDMTREYSAIGDRDAATAHRQFSPAQAVFGKKK
jgi:hypothetical protein